MNTIIWKYLSTGNRQNGAAIEHFFFYLKPKIASQANRAVYHRGTALKSVAVPETSSCSRLTDNIWLGSDLRLKSNGKMENKLLISFLEIRSSF